MDPLWSAALRRHWPLAGALGLFLVFLAVHLLVFQPASARYQRALREAQDAGLAVDPSQPIPVLPPRVYALIGDNTMPAAIATEQGSSGMLTAALLEEVTRLAERSGLDVLETEPSPISSDARAIQVRAHLEMRGSYAAFVALLDALARERRLFAVERFTVSPTGATRSIDLWVSRLVLKRDRGNP